MIGSVCVMVARATAPNAIGPGTVFPNVGTWDFSQGISGSPMASAPFWIALICQIVIVLGYFWFYRKEQLGMWCLFLSSAMVDVCDPFFSSSSPAVTMDSCFPFFRLFSFPFGLYIQTLASDVFASALSHTSRPLTYNNLWTLICYIYPFSLFLFVF